MTALFSAAALAAAATRLALLYASQRLVFGIAHDLSVSIFRRTLAQPYTYHLEHNSGETLAAINKAQLVTGAILMPLMQAASASVIALFILIVLLIIEPFIALGAGLTLGIIYLGLMNNTRRRILANGTIIARAQNERLRAASEGLGGIRDILLDHSQATFVKRFETIENRLRKAQALNNFVAQAPRFAVEGLGLTIIAIVSLLLTFRDGGIIAALPVLGAIALGAQRLVPLTQQIYYGVSATRTAGPMLDDILGIITLPAQAPPHPPVIEAIPFDSEIAFKSVSYSYPGTSRPTLTKFDLTVPKGSRIGIVGRTGSGKSTFVDLLLGLLQPTTGQILVDGEELNHTNLSAWQARLAHVPQSIYLTDASIAENIAFGVPPTKIDYERLNTAVTQAQLCEFISTLPLGYQTPVGERGVRLSGGQRQRIGIARALYKQVDILVLDEATSALDQQTELAVMNAIQDLRPNQTNFIIAHRLSTLEACNAIITIDGGELLFDPLRMNAVDH